MAGSAHATFFSFASDNSHQAPTFNGTSGSGGSFTITSPANSPFNLLIDDDNGAAPALSVPTRLVTNLTATSVGMSGFGSFMTYNYAVSGNVDFNDASNNLLLRINIAQAGPAVMTVVGGATTWGTAGAIIGADMFSTISYQLTPAGFAAFQAAASSAGQSLGLYKVFAAGTASPPNDFGFTLTALGRQGNPIGGTAVTIDPQTKLPTVAFQSESSYSGSVGQFPIPAPSSVALLGMAGLLTGRRRRA